jgi:hypothetical protein
MERSPVLTESRASHAHPAPESSEAKAVILRELEKILESPPFRGSSRRKEFLSYVVRHSLEGHHELLKERIIGTEVFHRDADYATGDDPVVRVQAGEVRRRLEQYYYSAPDVPVRIEIPTGSYSPVFHWNGAASQTTSSSFEDKSPEKGKSKLISRQLWWSIAGLCIIAVIAYAAVQWNARHKAAFQQFWAPLFSTQQPALICLAQGVTYRPSEGLYDRYAKTHPGTYQTEVERSTIPLPMDSKEKISWGDLEFESGYGVALGDVSAALKFSTLLGRLGKTNQARIGPNYSFEDLRNSPAIVIGAFNNRWTIDMLSNLRFAFLIENGEYKIREQLPGGRTWVSVYSKTHQLEEDYGIVARLLGSKTGQFTVAAAGLRDTGTEAAAELASNPELLTAAIHNAPHGWQSMNMEIIFKTSVTDSRPGPPQIVAIYCW